MLLGVAVAVIVVVGLVLVAFFTPLMSVRTTTVEGAKGVQTGEILHAAGVASGTPLLQVDTRVVAQRIAAIPSIESARVKREYPSSLRITVVERRATARVVDGDEVHVLDRTGVSYLTYTTKGLPGEYAALPVFTTPNPGPSDPTTVAAMKATAGLPDDISEQVRAVDASSPVDIEFTLEGNRKVVWGASTRGDEKARTLGYLMPRKASEYNVSSPDFPAYR